MADLQSLIDRGLVSGDALQRIMDRAGSPDVDLASLQRGQQAVDNRLTTGKVMDYLKKPAFDYMNRTHEATPVEQASDAAVNIGSNLLPVGKVLGAAAAVGPGIKAAAKEAAPALGRKLADVAHNRSLFDPLLEEIGKTQKAADLAAIHREYTGYDPVKTTKADIVKSMKNWQREQELNADLHAAQAKNPL